MTVREVVRNLCAEPVELIIRRWNWKSALLSSLCRGMIFFFANLSAGLHAAEGALLAELCYRGVTSGFYGALTQSFSTAEPAWAASLVALAVLPFGSHLLEFAVHLLRHTPNLALSFASSISFTALSTLFHLYAMRRGALIVRAGASSLAEDMRRMPRLILGFIAAGPMALAASLPKFHQASPRRNRNVTLTYQTDKTIS